MYETLPAMPGGNFAQSDQAWREAAQGKCGARSGAAERASGCASACRSIASRIVRRVYRQSCADSRGFVGAGTRTRAAATEHRADVENPVMRCRKAVPSHLPQPRKGERQRVSKLPRREQCGWSTMKRRRQSHPSCSARWGRACQADRMPRRMGSASSTLGEDPRRRKSSTRYAQQRLSFSPEKDGRANPVSAPPETSRSARRAFEPARAAIVLTVRDELGCERAAPKNRASSAAIRSGSSTRLRAERRHRESRPGATAITLLSARRSSRDSKSAGGAHAPRRDTSPPRRDSRDGCRANAGAACRYRTAVRTSLRAGRNDEGGLQPNRTCARANRRRH